MKDDANSDEVSLGGGACRDRDTASAVHTSPCAPSTPTMGFPQAPQRTQMTDALSMPYLCSKPMASQGPPPSDFCTRRAPRPVLPLSRRLTCLRHPGLGVLLGCGV